MNFLRSLLWVPFVFGIVMSGLALAEIIGNGLGTEFVGAPAAIVETYRALTSSVAYYLLEVPFDIFLPELAKDILVVWLMFGLTTLRVLTTSGRRWAGGRGGSNIYYMGQFFRVHYKIAIYTPSIFFYLLIVLTGPLSFFRSLYITTRPMTDDDYEGYRDYHYVSLPPEHLDAVDELAADTFRFEKRKRRIETFTLLFSLIANFIIGMAMMWWNSAEIERLAIGGV